MRIGRFVYMGGCGDRIVLLPLEADSKPMKRVVPVIHDKSSYKKGGVTAPPLLQRK